MGTLAEIMGQDIYDLIYVHYDINGNLIDDPEDVLYCEDDEIDEKRINSLKSLLVPVTNAKETLIPLEAAKLLAAWGVEEAVDYFEYCIDSRIDRLGNLEPHRLHGYDTTYEEIADDLNHYYARCYDRSADKKCFKKIEPLLFKILNLCKELRFNMLGLIMRINNGNWRQYEDQLKDCFILFLKKEEKDRNDYWNAVNLKVLFQNWDPEFLSEAEKKYGFIEVPKDHERL